MTSRFLNRTALGGGQVPGASITPTPAPTPAPTPTPTQTAGGAPTTFATTPTLHYHIPAGSTVTTQTLGYPALNNPQVATGVGDLRGTRNAVNALGTGPLVMTDGLGRRFLRFTTPAGGSGADHGGPNGPNLLQVPDIAVGSRGIAVFMVGRLHRSGTHAFLSLGTADNAPPNAGGPILGVQSGNSGSSPYLRCGSKYASTGTGDVSRIIMGSQMQVAGAASRTATTGANSNARLYLNTDVVTQGSLTSVATTGLTIGNHAFAPSGASFFDLYEMAIFLGDLTDAQADAIAAAMVANWAIPAVTDQLVLEGDSITAGIVTASDANAASGVLSGHNLAMLLTEPGNPPIPATCRVINQGVSGATIADLVTRRDAANSVFASGRLAGRNIVAFQIGRNDWTTDAASGTTEYQKIAGTGAYGASGLVRNDGGTGYLARGWEVVAAINIATAGAYQAANDLQRAAMRSAGFLTDCGAGAGQPYAGKLSILDLPAIRSGGASVFDTAADAQNTAVFQADNTHPNRQVGTPLMATGGDTPQYGYGSVL